MRETIRNGRGVAGIQESQNDSWLPPLKRPVCQTNIASPSVNALKMKHSEFEIGKTFWCGGRLWRCTDIGTRVIIAIVLEHDDDPSWYNGPPYAVGENYFDEFDIEGCSPEPDPYLVGEVQKFRRQRTESPTLCYPDDLIQFLDFFAEMDVTDGHFAAAKRARLSVRKRFTERDPVSGTIRDGFVVEAAFNRKTPKATES